MSRRCGVAEINRSDIEQLIDVVAGTLPIALEIYRLIRDRSHESLADQLPRFTFCFAPKQQLILFNIDVDMPADWHARGASAF
jgi:hypothetical protein